jgi:hypothetical protein
MDYNKATILEAYSKQELDQRFGELASQMQEVLRIISCQPQPEDLIPQAEAAKKLHVSVPTLIAWKKAGKIKSYAIGYKKYYKASELADALVQMSEKK